MKIEVITITRRDINHGEQNNCWHCPAALAVQRHFFPQSRYDRVSIDNGTIFVSGVGVFIMPSELNDWIGEYDKAANPTRSLKPFTFSLWQLPQARADYRRKLPYCWASVSESIRPFHD